MFTRKYEDGISVKHAGDTRVWLVASFDPHTNVYTLLSAAGPYTKTHALASKITALPFAEQARSFQIRDLVIQISNFVIITRNRGQSDDELVHWYTKQLAGDMDDDTQAEIRERVYQRLAQEK